VTARAASRAAVSALFTIGGILHFLRPGTYESIVPDVLPAHRALVYASGVAEIAGGVGAAFPRTRRPAGLWLVATLVGVFPANVDMALHPERYDGIPHALLLARLPLQAILVAWVLHATRD
jgi:uncharacterized membrane protein